MAEFINSEIKYIKPEEDTGIMLQPPIATVKFDVRIPGRFTIDVNEDGSWTCVADNDLLRKKDFTPCSKKPPEEDGCYLVYAPSYSGGSSSSKEIHDGVMFSKFKNGKWSIEVGYHKRPGCVEAWMPIPKYV